MVLLDIEGRMSMKLKLALATFALVVVPPVASAQCSHGDKTQSVSQCVDGELWDVTAQACVPVVNS